MESLGADAVIDYIKQDFTKSGEIYDVIFDAVIKTSYARCKDSLSEGGVYLTTDWPLVPALWASLTGGKRLVFGMANKNANDLTFLLGLVESGELKPVIDAKYPLEDIVEAHAYVGSGRKRGTVIVSVVSDPTS